MKKLSAKIVFWIRFAGWICLLPAALLVRLYQVQHSFMLLIMLGVIVLYAAYLLTTAGQERWQQPAKIQGAMIFTIIFVALLPAIPLFVAYRDALKLQQSK